MKYVSTFNPRRFLISLRAFGRIEIRTMKKAYPQSIKNVPIFAILRKKFISTYSVDLARYPNRMRVWSVYNIRYKLFFFFFLWNAYVYWEYLKDVADADLGSYCIVRLETRFLWVFNQIELLRFVRAWKMPRKYSFTLYSRSEEFFFAF